MTTPALSTNEVAAEACSEGRFEAGGLDGAFGGFEAGGFAGALGGFDAGGFAGSLGGFEAGGFAGVLGGFDVGGFAGSLGGFEAGGFAGALGGFDVGGLDGSLGGLDGSLGGFDVGGFAGSLGGFEAGGFAGALGGFDTGGFDELPGGFAADGSVGVDAGCVVAVAFEAFKVAEQPVSSIRLDAAAMPSKSIQHQRARLARLTAKDLSIQTKKRLDRETTIESRTASCLQPQKDHAEDTSALRCRITLRAKGIALSLTKG